MSPACSAVCPGIGRTILWILLSSELYSCLKHYHLVTQRKTWLEAQKHCREKFTDLASVDDMEEMKQLIAAAGNGYEGKVWIGLYDEPDKWHWSYEGSDFYGVGERDFRKWREGQPDDLLGSGALCVYMRSGGYWGDYPCDKLKLFFCYDNTNPKGLPTTATERYVFVNAKKKWDQAWYHCYLHHTDLPSVRNEMENEVIRQKVPPNSKVTIGLKRLIWSSWSDNKFHSFRNWADGHPSNLTKSCAASVINSTYLGKWMECSCNEKLYFMCQHDPINKFTVKLTAVAPTMDLNDPAVLEAILNELKKKMKEKGFTKDLKISWIKKPGKDIFHKEKKAKAVKTEL